MVSRKKYLTLFLVISLALSCGLVFAEQAKDKKKKEKDKKSIFRPHEEIVVTATMTRKAVKDCSASVSVIREDDLEALSANNALNILNSFPGIFVRRTGDFGRADVDIRGIGQRGRRIAILVDGRPEKMGLFGCVVTHTFPLDNVERMEVVRGPSSVLYGSEALGGVINILTYTPKRKFESDFRASYGSFNTQLLNLRQGGNLNKFSYYLTFDWRRSDEHRDNSGYSGNSFTGKMSYDLSDQFQATFQGKYFKGKKYEAGSIEFPLSDFWNDYERGAVDFSLRGEGEKDELFMKLYRNFGHHQFSDGWHSRDYINGGVARYTTHRITNNELTLGVDFRVLGGKSYNWPEGSWEKKEAALFFHNQHVFWKKWILSTGLRLHRDSLYGSEICPHWGLVLQASKKTLLRAMINKGFRSPQLNELYMYPAANPELKPERVWNYEIGFQQEIKPWLTLDASLYQMKGSNLIETRPNATPPPSYKFINTERFTFKGLEISLGAEFYQNLSALLFYTYLDPGEKTKGRPGQKLDFSLRFREEFFSASLQAQYVTDYFAENYSASPLPSYILTNARLTGNISHTMEVFLDVNNIFNKNYMIYVELPGIAEGAYPMPGRNLNFGIRIKK